MKPSFLHFLCLCLCFCNFIFPFLTGYCPSIFDYFDKKFLIVDEPAIREQATQLEQIQGTRLVLDSEPIKGSCSCVRYFH